MSVTKQFQEPSDAPFKILLVEDDEVDQMAFKRMVKNQGLPYHYIIVNSIDEARKLLNQKDFDVVIVDYFLGDGTAFDLMDLLADVPVIVATGAGDEEIAARAMKTGAFDYLIKDAAQKYLTILPITVENAIKHKRAQERFRLLSHALMNISDSVYFTDLDGKIVFVNPAFCSTYGYGEAEILGKEDASLFAEPSQRLKDFQALQPFSDREFYHRRKDGTVFPVSFSQSFLKDENGAPSAIVVVIRDISERKQAEMKLKESRERYRRLVELSPDAIAIVQSGELKFINKSGAKMFGAAKTELMVGKEIIDLVHASSRQNVREFLSKIVEEEVPLELKEEKFVRGDGGEIILEITGIPFFYENDLAVQLIMRDITDRKKTEEALRKSEEQLRQAQKMEAVGRLAGGIAHDFNNLLLVIKGYSDLLINELDSSSEFYEYVEEIRKAGDMAAAMTRQLLAISRRQAFKPRPINLNRIIQNMEALLKRLIGEKITLRIILDPNLGYIRADSGQMEQVIINLAVNAKDAMPDGGSLIIETENIEITHRHIRNSLEPEPGNYVRLSVTDTGCGIDETIRPHIFEPFYTTKPKGKGTGLGLSTVYGIVKQNEGHIEVYSEVETGTTIKIYLPQVSKEDVKMPPSTKSKRVYLGKETVLLVEDEKPVRKLVKKLLIQNGYKVMEAEHAEEALKFIKSQKEPVDLLLTDVIMPGLNGPELALEIKNFFPDIKVLFISGYSENVSLEQGHLNTPYYFLQKPFSPETLLKKMRKILDSPQIQSNPNPSRN